MIKECEGRCYAVIKVWDNDENEDIDIENACLNEGVIKRKDAVFLTCRP